LGFIATTRDGCIGAHPCHCRKPHDPPYAGHDGKQKAESRWGMSYQQFQQKCDDCGKSWDAVSGVVGNTIMGNALTKCPYCESVSVAKYADDIEEKILDEVNNAIVNERRYAATTAREVGEQIAKRIEAEE
jgi:hypothetical protein